MSLLTGCPSAAPAPDGGASSDGAVGDAEDTAEISADVAPRRTSLIDHDAWQPTGAADDPFDDRPATPACERGFGWAVESFDTSQTLSVDTSLCDYLTVDQPLSREVAAGSSIELRIWHFELVGDGEAHLAIQIGAVPLWEAMVPIPRDSQLLFETIVAPQDLGAGTPIYFHLHNHGTNTYNLIDVALVEDA